MTTNLCRRDRRDDRTRPRLENRAGSDAKTIVGYAAVFYDAADPGTEFELYQDCYERIMPPAIRKPNAWIG